MTCKPMPSKPRHPFALAAHRRRAGAHRPSAGARRQRAERAWRADLAPPRP